jgi:hypothetical protein
MKYRDKKGNPLGAGHPKRLIWQGMAPCDYWTDDWDHLEHTQGIPRCPICLAFGDELSAEIWEKLKKEKNLKYAQFLLANKERCFSPAGGWHRFKFPLSGT